MCLWFISKNRSQRTHSGANNILFIDASKFGTLESRTYRTLSDQDVSKIASTYHSWRSGDEAYQDQLGHSKAASPAEIASRGHVLAPGRYVEALDAEDDSEPTDEKLARLTGELFEEFEAGHRIEALIRERLGILS